MFTAAPKPAPPVHKPQPAASSAASSAASASGAASRQGQGGPAGAGAGGGVRGAQPTPKAAPKAAAPASMIDFGNEAALLAEHPDLYKGLEEVPGTCPLQTHQFHLLASQPLTTACALSHNVKDLFTMHDTSIIKLQFRSLMVSGMFPTSRRACPKGSKLHQTQLHVEHLFTLYKQSLYSCD